MSGGGWYKENVLSWGVGLNGLSVSRGVWVSGKHMSGGVWGQKKIAAHPTPGTIHGTALICDVHPIPCSCKFIKRIHCLVHTYQKP